MELIGGDDYEGRFRVNMRKREVSRGSHYTEYLEDRFWWEGEGAVTDLRKNINQRFIFSSRENDGRELPFKDSLIYFKEGYDIFDIDSSRIINYRAIVDLVLEQLFNDAKQSLNDKDNVTLIPHVSPKPLNLSEMMRNRGFVSEESGQLNLALSGMLA